MAMGIDQTPLSGQFHAGNAPRHFRQRTGNRATAGTDLQYFVCLFHRNPAYDIFAQMREMIEYRPAFPLFYHPPVRTGLLCFNDFQYLILYCAITIEIFSRITGVIYHNLSHCLSHITHPLLLLRIPYHSIRPYFYQRLP